MVFFAHIKSAQMSMNRRPGDFVSFASEIGLRMDQHDGLCMKMVHGFLESTTAEYRKVLEIAARQADSSNLNDLWTSSLRSKKA